MVLSDIIERMRGEDLDMPSLRLTATPAQRVWKLDRRACEQLLRRLIEDRVLGRGGERPLVPNQVGPR